MTTPNARRTRGAFTLIELLTVIAIIGVLASILVPTVSRVRETARRSQCASNLRQIGMSILLYTQGNGDLMPGPLFTGQGPRFNIGNTGNLALLLEPYLPSNVNTVGTVKRQRMFECPAWLQATPTQDGPSLHVNVNPRDWNNAAPFGRIGGSGGDLPPLRFSQITRFNLSRTWMLIDVDKVWLEGSPAPSWLNQIPDRPVHGESRNVLYFDGHVGLMNGGPKPADI